MTKHSPDLQIAFPDQSLDLYGETELMGMLDDNRATGLIPNQERQLASSHMGQLAAEVIAQAHPLANIDPDFRTNIEKARLTAQEVFDRTYYSIPELGDLVDAGVDFNLLAQKHGIMESLGLKPELVIAPTLPMTGWENLFEALMYDQEVNQIL